MSAPPHVPHVSRRRLVQSAGLTGLGVLAGCGRLPGQAPPFVRRVGVLFDGLPAASPESDVLRQRLGELGWVEGQNLTIEFRSGQAQGSGRLLELANELVQSQVEVLVTGGVSATRVAQTVSDTLPIVMVSNQDPVAAGLVTGFARPSGNVTGVTNFGQELGSKRLELLIQAGSAVTRVGVMGTFGDQPHPALVEITTGAKASGVQVQALSVRQADDVESAFQAARAGHADALIVLDVSGTLANQQLVIDLAVRNRLPAIYESRLWPEAGGLMSYAPNRKDLFRRVAYFVDKILRGTRVADLPIEQPMTFDHIINLKTAQALGLAIPQHVLLQATEIIR